MEASRAAFTPVRAEYPSVAPSAASRKSQSSLLPEPPEARAIALAQGCNG